MVKCIGMCVCVCMCSFSLPLLPLPLKSLCVYVYKHTHTQLKIKEAVCDDDASDFFGKKMQHVVANYAGCLRQDWKSGMEIVWGFGER